MTLEHGDPELTYGYLSTWDSADHGCLGGYLIVSMLGRPLEFHCTAPLRPSRAQQILFGPTLWPYVFGDQIGGALFKEANLRPRVILVDHPATLCLRSQFGIPMVRLVVAGSREFATANPGQGAGSTEKESVSKLPTTSDLAKTPAEVDGCELELPPGFEADRDKAVQLLTVLARHIDLAEPFDRIREAIREAQRLSERDPQEAHEQAA
jgi:hypothetical protein